MCEQKQFPSTKPDKLSDGAIEMPFQGAQCYQSSHGSLQGFSQVNRFSLTEMPIGSWKIKEDQDQTRELSDSVPKVVGENKAN